MNLTIVLRRSLAILFCLVAAATLRAQSPPKMAIINLRLAIASTAEGKQFLADFETKFAPRQNELNEINRKIEELAKQIQAKQSTWSDEQKAKAQIEGQRLTRMLNRKQADYQSDRNAAKEDIVQTIGGRLVPVIDRYARENNLGTVIDSSGPGAPLLFVSPTVDITEPVAKLYDQTHPVKSTAAAPAKPATAPAKPAPATKAAPSSPKP